MNSHPTGPVLLYVEDEVLIQTMVVEDLEEAGFCVVAARSGQEALGILQRDHGRLQGLITDINLGSGPDGWQVARTARELQATMPVVYLSAASTHEWASHGVPASIMIAKPFAPAQILVAISSLLTVSD